ncbi:MAG TPA: ThaI family type II restriction endonuclease [Candidatus Nanoarchaeia archaeon]|nr:ThaI family type II restriction endonuclease [Candidatus Nanoarchaeia archaeon]
MNKMADIKELFTDNITVSEIQAKLPKLFRIAEIESSRAGKIGMEVGSLREKVIGGLLIYKFGEVNVNTEIPITESETDVILAGKNLSVKTITGNGGVKAVWTVDAESSKNFIDNYIPKCDILLIQIWWGENKDSLFFIPLNVQKEIFNLLGKEKYLKMPKAGTNPRGVEFSKESIQKMLQHPKTSKIKINWIKQDIPYNVYKRWIDFWKE